MLAQLGKLIKLRKLIPGLSGLLLIFKDFPVLEFFLGKKFKDFPGFSRPVDTCVLQEKS
jgi:hypothetical protein